MSHARGGWGRGQQQQQQQQVVVVGLEWAEMVVIQVRGDELVLALANF
jgi:hypothetical protein